MLLLAKWFVEGLGHRGPTNTHMFRKKVVVWLFQKQYLPANVWLFGLDALCLQKAVGQKQLRDPLIFVDFDAEGGRTCTIGLTVSVYLNT